MITELRESEKIHCLYFKPVYNIIRYYRNKRKCPRILFSKCNSLSGKRLNVKQFSQTSQINCPCTTTVAKCSSEIILEEFNFITDDSKAREDQMLPLAIGTSVIINTSALTV